MRQAGAASAGRWAAGFGLAIAVGVPLGTLTAVAYRTLETPDMYVAILAVSICGYALDRALLATRRRLLTWSAEAG